MKDSKYQFSAPSTILMVEADSLKSLLRAEQAHGQPFFVYGILQCLYSRKNAYTFYNISNLVTKMHNAKLEGEKIPTG